MLPFQSTLGGLFMLDDAKVPTFLKGHGSAEFEAYCDSVLPKYKQCAGKLCQFFSLKLTSNTLQSIRFRPRVTDPHTTLTM